MSDAADWTRRPTAELVLTDADTQAAYASRTAAALERARLNESWPPARLLADQLRAMSPAVHRGLYPHLRVDVRTGLPTYSEWTRIYADHERAPALLEGLDPRDQLLERARAAPDTIHGKQLLKHDYHRDLLDLLAESPPTSRMQVALRRVDPESRTAWFHVVLDKLDASGIYVRFSIDLSQRSSFWRRTLVELDDHAARETEGFRSTIFRLSGLDAEFTFVRLARTNGLQVERVVKGTVGPFFMPGTNHPTDLAEVFAGHDPQAPGQGPLIASFGLDMAALDVARDGDNDPLEDLLTEQLSEVGRQGYVEARSTLGYHVFKDRKFVVSSPDLVDVVHRFTAPRDARNIVYVLR